MGRLFVVSNRVAPIEEGKPASGGLAVGVLDALTERGGVWFGWSGRVTTTRRRKPKLSEKGNLTFATIDLSREDYDQYYNGFANETLWPLMHLRLDKMRFSRRDFAGYLRVNTRFANTLALLLGDDDVVWVHDYHLIPLGEELRLVGMDQPIGFFLHTPFPPFDVLAALPTHKHLIRALCAYDLVGFQTAGDLTAFQDAIVRSAGGVVRPSGTIKAFGRTLRAQVFPIGIDTEEMGRIAMAAMRSTSVKRVRQDLSGGDLVIGVDRLDYSKGLVERFQAYALFLERYSQFRTRVRFLQIATLTRRDIPEYGDLRRVLGSFAGDIAGRFGEPHWNPIQYLNKSFARSTLAGFFRISRIGLVTPLKDGMNLVAKEYVAAQDPKDPGVLVLSALAGAARELESALIVNPYDVDAVAEALKTGLGMGIDERVERWRAMIDVLKRNDITAWHTRFLRALTEAPDAGAATPISRAAQSAPRY